MLAPFECLCGNFILPEPASYVFFYALFNLRKLLYIIWRMPAVAYSWNDSFALLRMCSRCRTAGCQGMRFSSPSWAGDLPRYGNILSSRSRYPLILGGALLPGSKPPGEHGDHQLVHPLQPAAVNAALEGKQGDALRNGGGLSNLVGQCSGITQPNGADSTEVKTACSFDIALDLARVDSAQIDCRAAAGELRFGFIK